MTSTPLPRVRPRRLRETPALRRLVSETRLHPADLVLPVFVKEGLTEPRERLMREEFGCGLRQFLFEPNTPGTRALIRERIVRTIARWEPRVRVEDVTVDADPADERLIAITIVFRMVATGVPGRLGMSLQLEG